MHGFVTNIEEATLKNTNYRKVLFTGKHEQLVLMRLKPGEEIGEEKHKVDQFFRVERGRGVVKMEDKEVHVKQESAFIVPAGAKHNVINTSEVDDLKFYTIYSKPQHEDGVIHKTKKDSERDEGH